MTLLDQLKEDLKSSLKQGDVLTRDTVRLILSAIQNAQIAKGRDLDQDGLNEVLNRMAKQYRDSIAVYSQADRNDLAAKEEAELAVVNRYLPEQLSEDEVRLIAQKTIGNLAASSIGDRGKVMRELMPQLRGRADGSLVSSIVAELLES